MSRADAIREALIIGGTVEQIVDAVMTAIPNDDPKKVRSQTKVIIKETKVGKGVWKRFNLNDQNGHFQIVVKDGPAPNKKPEPVPEPETKKPIKEKVVMESVSEPNVVAPAPEISFHPALKIDATGIVSSHKILGLVTRAFYEAGWPADKIRTVRSDLAIQGITRDAFIRNANKYLVVEDRQSLALS